MNLFGFYLVFVNFLSDNNFILKKDSRRAEKNVNYELSWNTKIDWIEEETWWLTRRGLRWPRIKIRFYELTNKYLIVSKLEYKIDLCYYKKFWFF